MNGGGRAHALKHLLPEGKVSRVLMLYEGAEVSKSLLRAEAFGAHTDLPFLHMALLAHVSFCAWHPIAILDLSGLEQFCSLAIWQRSALVPISKDNLKTKH